MKIRINLRTYSTFPPNTSAEYYAADLEGDRDTLKAEKH